ncbi:MAG: class I SAM-dependent methyltransferase [Mariprofundaceae bacterium]
MSEERTDPPGSRPIFETCPLGCGLALQSSGIVLLEGVLRRCPGCGQLLSSCDSRRFGDSMREFDAVEGTLPTGRAEKRYQQRVGKVLEDAAGTLGRRPDDLRLLDVGCSSGALLRVARGLGYTVNWVEPAKQAAATARADGFEVYPGLLQEAHFASNSYDLVTLFEVIEHLTDPISVINEIHRILQPGGLLLIGTGNGESWTATMLGAKWEYFDIASHGGHISFFTPHSMRLLAEKTGFHIETIMTKRVNLAERRDVSAFTYALARLGREFLALPARWLGKGHDMLVILHKPTR